MQMQLMQMAGVMFITMIAFSGCAVCAHRIYRWTASLLRRKVTSERNQQ